MGVRWIVVEGELGGFRGGVEMGIKIKWRVCMLLNVLANVDVRREVEEEGGCALGWKWVKGMVWWMKGMCNNG